MKIKVIKTFYKTPFQNSVKEINPNSLFRVECQQTT